MKKQSQKDIVLYQLQKYGEIYNAWCFEHGILRLGGIMHKLRNEGHDIETDDSRRNCRYIYKPKDTLF